MLRKLLLRSIYLQFNETKPNTNKELENKKIVYLVQKRVEERD